MKSPAIHHRETRREAEQPGALGADGDGPPFPPSGGLRSRWLVPIFLCGILFYGYLFYVREYDVPDSSAAKRVGSLAFALIPDEMIRVAWGNDWRRFGVLDRLPILTVCGLVTFLAYAIGDVALSWLRMRAVLGRLEQLVFAVAIGLNTISLLVLGIGLAGQLRNRWLFALLALAIVALWVAVRRSDRGRGLHPNVSLSRTPAEQAEWRAARHWLWLAAPFAFCCILGGMLPPWQFDVREYHLQVPKEWFQAGRVEFLPHNVYGNMPLSSEILGICGMLALPGELDWWYGSLVGKTLMAAFSLWGALALLAAGWRFYGPRVGVWAVVVYLSIPWVVNEAMTGLIEGSVAFYGFMATFALVHWSRRAESTSDDAPWNFGWPLMAGYLAGAAAACKYPGVVFVTVPLFVWVAAASCWQRAWKPIGAFTLAVLCGCGLWYGKNWVLAGNPTYPLLYSVFGGHTRTPENDAQWRQAHQVPVDAAGRKYSAGQLLESFQLLGWRSSLLSPILWPWAAVGLFAGWNYRRGVGWLAAIIAVQWAVWWLVTHRLDRFFVPSFIWVSLLAGIGAAILWQQARYLVAGLGLLSVLANLLFMHSRMEIEVSDIRYFIALDDLRLDFPRKEDFFFTRVHPTRRYLNQTVRDGSRVLLVGDAQVFDMEVPILYNTCFDESHFDRLFRGKTRAERLAALHRENISHVFIFWVEIDRYRSPGNYGYSDYITRELVRQELVEEQRLLIPVKTSDNPDNTQLFRVAES